MSADASDQPTPSSPLRAGVNVECVAEDDELRRTPCNTTLGGGGGDAQAPPTVPTPELPPDSTTSDSPTGELNGSCETSSSGPAPVNPPQNSLSCPEPTSTSPSVPEAPSPLASGPELPSSTAEPSISAPADIPEPVITAVVVAPVPDPGTVNGPPPPRTTPKRTARSLQVNLDQIVRKLSGVAEPSRIVNGHAPTDNKTENGGRNGPENGVSGPANNPPDRVALDLTTKSRADSDDNGQVKPVKWGIMKKTGSVEKAPRKKSLSNVPSNSSANSLMRTTTQQASAAAPVVPLDSYSPSLQLLRIPQFVPQSPDAKARSEIRISGLTGGATVVTQHETSLGHDDKKSYEKRFEVRPTALVNPFPGGETSSSRVVLPPSLKGPAMDVNLTRSCDRVPHPGLNGAPVLWSRKGGIEPDLTEPEKTLMPVVGKKGARHRPSPAGAVDFKKALAPARVAAPASSRAAGPLPPPSRAMTLQPPLPPPGVRGAAKRKRSLKNMLVQRVPMVGGVPVPAAQMSSVGHQTQMDVPVLHQLLGAAAQSPEAFSVASILGAGSGGAVSITSVDGARSSPVTDPSVVDRLKRLGTVIEVEEDPIPPILPDKEPPLTAPSALKMLEKMTIDPPQSPVVSALDDRPLFLGKDISVYAKKKVPGPSYVQPPPLSIIPVGPPMTLPPPLPLVDPSLSSKCLPAPSTPSKLSQPPVPHLPLLTITKAAPKPLSSLPEPKTVPPPQIVPPAPIVTVTKTASTSTTIDLTKPSNLPEIPRPLDKIPESKAPEPLTPELPEPPLTFLEPVIVIDEDDSPLSSDGKFVFKHDNSMSVELPNDQKMFSCDICSAAFHHLHLLRKHYFRLHVARKYISEKDLEAYNIDPEKSDDSNDEFIYRCHTCRQCLPTKAELKSHLTDHPPVDDLNKHNKGAKDYRCERCNAHFKWRKIFGKHKRACKAPLTSETMSMTSETLSDKKPSASMATDSLSDESPTKDLPITAVTELALRQVIDTRAVRNLHRTAKAFKQPTSIRKTRLSVALAVHSPPAELVTDKPEVIEDPETEAISVESTLESSQTNDEIKDTKGSQLEEVNSSTLSASVSSEIAIPVDTKSETQLASSPQEKVEFEAPSESVAESAIATCNDVEQICNEITSEAVLRKPESFSKCSPSMSVETDDKKPEEKVVAVDDACQGTVDCQELNKVADVEGLKNVVDSEEVKNLVDIEELKNVVDTDVEESKIQREESIPTIQIDEISANRDTKCEDPSSSDVRLPEEVNTNEVMVPAQSEETCNRSEEPSVTEVNPDDKVKAHEEESTSQETAATTASAGVPTSSSVVLTLSTDKIDMKSLFHCLYCNETFNNNNKRRHHTLSNHPYVRKGHPCVFCKGTKESFPTNVALFNHLISIHLTLYFACQTCKERFHSLDELKDHSIKRHPPDSPERKDLEARSSEVDEEALTFTCAACQRIWLFKSCFLEHKCNPEKDRAPATDKTGRLPKLRKVKSMDRSERSEKTIRVDPETMFYSQVSMNVRNNLLHFLDGKLPQDDDEEEVADESATKVPERNMLSFSAGFPGSGLQLVQEPEPYSRVKAQWEKYNFPKNYDGRCGLTSYIKDMSYLDISTQLIMRRNLQRLQGDPEVTSPSTSDDVPSVLALERLATQCAESFGINGIPGGDGEALSLGELSGEWVRDRLYVCSVCSWETPCLWSMEDHKYEVHPQVLCPQHELVGDQRSLADTIYTRITPHEEQPFSSDRILRPSPVKLSCTKCNADGFISRPELHVHVLACAGEPIPQWAPTPRKKRWNRKRRRPRRGLKRNIPSTPHRPIKVRTKPGDTDTIQKMIANLPAKRSTRRVIGFDEGDLKTRSQSTIQNGPVLLPSSRLVLPPSHGGLHKHSKSPKGSPKSKDMILAPPLVPKGTDLIDTSAERGDVLSSLRMMPVSTPREELLEPRQIIDKVINQKVLGKQLEESSGHPCTGCGQSSESKNALRKHQKGCAYFRECGPNAEHKCKACARLFDSLVSLIEHSCDEMPQLEIEKDLSPVNSAEIPVLSPVQHEGKKSDSSQAQAKQICGVSFVNGKICYETAESVEKEIGALVGKDGESNLKRTRSHSLGDIPSGKKLFRLGHRRSARLGQTESGPNEPESGTQKPEVPPAVHDTSQAMTDEDTYESAPESRLALRGSKSKRLPTRAERSKNDKPKMTEPPVKLTRQVLEIRALEENLSKGASSPSVDSEPFIDDDSVWEKQAVIDIDDEPRKPETNETETVVKTEEEPSKDLPKPPTNDGRPKPKRRKVRALYTIKKKNKMPKGKRSKMSQVSKPLPTVDHSTDDVIVNKPVDINDKSTSEITPKAEHDVPIVENSSTAEVVTVEEEGTKKNGKASKKRKALKDLLPTSDDSEAKANAAESSKTSVKKNKGVKNVRRKVLSQSKLVVKIKGKASNKLGAKNKKVPLKIKISPKLGKNQGGKDKKKQTDILNYLNKTPPTGAPESVIEEAKVQVISSVSESAGDDHLAMSIDAVACGTSETLIAIMKSNDLSGLLKLTEMSENGVASKEEDVTVGENGVQPAENSVLEEDGTKKFEAPVKKGGKGKKKQEASEVMSKEPDSILDAGSDTVVVASKEAPPKKGKKQNKKNASPVQDASLNVHEMDKISTDGGLDNSKTDSKEPDSIVDGNPTVSVTDAPPKKGKKQNKKKLVPGHDAPLNVDEKLVDNELDKSKTDSEEADSIVNANTDSAIVASKEAPSKKGKKQNKKKIVPEHDASYVEEMDRSLVESELNTSKTEISKKGPARKKGKKEVVKPVQEEISSKPVKEESTEEPVEGKSGENGGNAVPESIEQELEASVTAKEAVVRKRGKKSAGEITDFVDIPAEDDGPEKMPSKKGKVANDAGEKAMARRKSKKSSQLVESAEGAEVPEGEQGKSQMLLEDPKEVLKNDSPSKPATRKRGGRSSQKLEVIEHGKSEVGEDEKDVVPRLTRQQYRKEVLSELKFSAPPDLVSADQIEESSEEGASKRVTPTKTKKVGQKGSTMTGSVDEGLNSKESGEKQVDETDSVEKGRKSKKKSSEKILDAGISDVQPAEEIEPTVFYALVPNSTVTNECDSLKDDVVSDTDVPEIKEDAKAKKQMTKRGVKRNAKVIEGDIEPTVEEIDEVDRSKEVEEPVKANIGVQLSSSDEIPPMALSGSSSRAGVANDTEKDHSKHGENLSEQIKVVDPVKIIDGPSVLGIPPDTTSLASRAVESTDKPQETLPFKPRNKLLSGRLPSAIKAAALLSRKHILGDDPPPTDEAKKRKIFGYQRKTSPVRPARRLTRSNSNGKSDVKTEPSLDPYDYNEDEIVPFQEPRFKPYSPPKPILYVPPPIKRRIRKREDSPDTTTIVVKAEVHPEPPPRRRSDVNSADDTPATSSPGDSLPTTTSEALRSMKRKSDSSSTSDGVDVTKKPKMNPCYDGIDILEDEGSDSPPPALVSSFKVEPSSSPLESADSEEGLHEMSEVTKSLVTTLATSFALKVSQLTSAKSPLRSASPGWKDDLPSRVVPSRGSTPSRIESPARLNSPSRIPSPARGRSPVTRSPARISSPARTASPAQGQISPVWTATPLRSYGRVLKPPSPSCEPPELVDESKVKVEEKLDADSSSPVLQPAEGPLADLLDLDPPALEPTGDLAALVKTSNDEEDTETAVDTEEESDSLKNFKFSKKKMKDLKLRKKRQLLMIKAMRNKKKKDTKKSIFSTTERKEVVKISGMDWEVSDLKTSPMKSEPYPPSPPARSPPLSIVKDWDAGDLWDSPIVAPSSAPSAVPVPNRMSPIYITSRMSPVSATSGMSPVEAFPTQPSMPPVPLPIPALRSQRSDSGGPTPSTSLGCIIDSVNKLLDEPESNFSNLPSHYSLADLQKAMGASDDDMAVLQRLGEATSCLQEYDDKSSVIPSCEDEWGPMIMDLDNQAAQQPIVSSSVAESTTAPAQPPDVVPVAHAPSQQPPAGSSAWPQPSSPAQTATYASFQSRFSREDLSGLMIRSSSMCKSLRMSPKCSSTSLLAAHNNKEVVCPTCSCHFMGFTALQIHVNKVHGSSHDPTQVTGGLHKRVVLESAKSSSRLVCFECQQILPSHLMYRHLEVDHILDAAQIAKCSTVTGDPHVPVGGERLKNKMSSALGDLLDKAVSNLLTVKSKPDSPGTPGLSGSAMELLSRLCAVRKRADPRMNSKDASFNKLKNEIKLEDEWARPLASRPYLCSVCGQRFPLASSRNKHEVLAHRSYRTHEEIPLVKEEYFDDDDWRDAPSPTESTYEGEGAAATLTPTCSDCGLSFESVAYLLKHRVEDHGPRRRSSTASLEPLAPVSSSTPASVGPRKISSASRSQSLDTNPAFDSDDSSSTAGTKSGVGAGTSSTGESPPPKRSTRSRPTKSTANVVDKARAEAALRQLNVPR